MQIYNRPDQYHFTNTQDHIFQEDLDLIQTYSIEQLNEYINNCEISLLDIENDTLNCTEAELSQYKLVERSFYLDNPFRLYWNPDPAGDHGRICIKQFDPEHDTPADFEDNQNLGKYIVGFYDVEPEPIQFFKNYMEKLVLLKKLEQENPPKEVKDPMTLRDSELGNGATKTRSNKIKI
ncbi:TPA: hypothetical protein QDB06_000796 [Burkholderia vietnamiensis]|nr:hypothetical protein [Burkholderia vietnamiensis]